MSEAIIRKARESAEVSTRFFDEHWLRIERVASELATRLSQGGRLFTMGNGGSACDAMHAAIEFQHPIIEKRRALAASALCADSALVTALGNDNDFSRVFALQLERSAHKGDVALGISTSGTSANVVRAIRRARGLGIYTIAFCGRDGGALADAAQDAFVVPSWSIHRIQEVHVVLLHVLWDAVHLALGEPDVL